MDLGLDGVAIDLEDDTGGGPTGCPSNCSTNTEYVNAILNLRQALGPSKILTTAPASVGAYGQWLTSAVTLLLFAQYLRTSNKGSGPLRCSVRC